MLNRRWMEDHREETTTRDGSIGWKNTVPSDVKIRDQPLRDISSQGVWTLSSCKHGYGVNELLSDNVEKYWQSDGPQPHTIIVEFQKKTDISFIMLYLDFKNDESYTPSKIVARMGSSLQDMFFRTSINLQEPQGWVPIDLRDDKQNPQRAWYLQIQVVQNHQNGRDTHIRHVRIVGPTRSRFSPESRLLAGEPYGTLILPPNKEPNFTNYLNSTFAHMNLR